MVVLNLELRAFIIFTGKSLFVLYNGLYKMERS